MSEPPHHTPGEIAQEVAHHAAEAAAEVAHEVAVAAKRSWKQIALIVAIVTIAVFGALVAAMRYGVLIPQARLLIAAATDGLKVGRFGRLKIEGLTGDIWTDLSIQRLTLRDEKGIWLEADRVHLKWRYLELLRRNFQADDIAVGELKLVRRPTLTQGGEAGGLPLSFHIDHAAGRLSLEPGFSGEPGSYDLDFNLHVERKGGQRGHVRAASVLRPGDHLNADYDIAPDRPLLVMVDAVEAKGGALAGAVGLPSNLPFALRINASGQTAQGQFTATALSGNTQPLQAQGSWDRQQGEAHGRAALTASSLTAGWARRLGPEARFQVTGRRAGPDLFALQGTIQAENLGVTASGLGNLGTRTIGPQGVNVMATTPALSRITGGPTLGPARVAGVLTSAGAGWRFAGQAAVSRAALGGYALERASGPVVLTSSKGEVALNARLAGAGGRGSGFIAAALGGAPKAAFDGARLADGRLALRQLEVNGAGLKLSASGGRSLLGGLTFKGQASLGNLAAARAGASGAAQASWSASQGKVGQPWALAFDARGEKFATGYPELDRLLGAKPELKAHGSVQGRRVAIAEAHLNGAALQLASAGVIDGGKLALKLDWSANGPFHAGPVEIAGKARGSGAITGTFGQPKADLLAHLDQVDAPRLPLKDVGVTLTFEKKPDGSAGVIAATAQSGFGPARGRSAFRFPEGGIDLTDLSVDAGGLKAAGSVSLRHSAPSAADLDLTVTRGAFLDAGKIAGHVQIAEQQGARANLDLTAENARFPGSEIVIHAGRITADGSTTRLPYQLTADGTAPQGKWSAAGRGVLAQAKPGWQAGFDGQGKLGGRTFRTLETAAFRFGGPERSARLRLAASDGGRLDLDGRLAADTADIRAHVVGLGLQMLDEDLTGKFDADLTLGGKGGRLDGALDAKLAGARGRGSPAASGVDGTVRGRLAGDVLTLSANATNAQGLQANGDITLPAATSAAPFRIAIARQQPMRGRFFAEGEVRPLWDLLVGGDRSLAGKVRTQGTLGGTLADPRLAGEVAVDNGRFDDGETGLALRQVSLRAGFENSAINVSQAAGVDGHGGSVNGQGRISLEREGVSSFRLNLKGFRLIDNEIATASATGQATIDRAANGKVRLSGDLLIDQANVAARVPTPTGVVALDVIEKNRPPELAPVVAAQPAFSGEGWALDVKLRAPSRIYLRGHGLNVELSLDAHVGGTTSHPQLGGTARVVRGDYDFAGKRFEFDPQSVVYLSTNASQIRLELIATRDDPTLSATVHVRGTAAKPEITLTSSPALPSDEVLSQVLFGRTASQLSPLEAAQLASTLSSLAGGGGLDVIGNLRTFAGLDRLALGGGTTGEGVTVSGGKYLTDNVYLEITGGSRQGSSAQVEWRLKRSLSLVSKIGEQSGGSLSIRWRKDY